MTTHTSLSSASRPGAFIEAVTLAARADHKDHRNWDRKAPSSGPRFRSVIAGLSVVMAVVGATLASKGSVAKNVSSSQDQIQQSVQNAFGNCDLANQQLTLCPENVFTHRKTQPLLIDRA